jgi:hypothetical protein
MVDNKLLGFKELTSGDIRSLMRMREYVSSLPIGQHEAFIRQLDDDMSKACEHILKLALDEACKLGLLSILEYEQNYKGRYVWEGYDSFADLLLTIVNKPRLAEHESPVFVTINEKMLQDSKKLEQRFGIRIISPEEAVELMGKMSNATNNHTENNSATHKEQGIK